MINYYKVLWIENYSDIEIVKRAYRKLAMSHHPDMWWEEKVFILINTAYEKLRDKENKERYDYNLRIYIEDLNRVKEEREGNEDKEYKQYSKNSSWANRWSQQKEHTRQEQQKQESQDKQKKEKVQSQQDKYEDYTKRHYEKYKRAYYEEYEEDEEDEDEEDEYEYEYEYEEYEEDEEYDIRERSRQKTSNYEVKDSDEEWLFWMIFSVVIYFIKLIIRIWKFLISKEPLDFRWKIWWFVFLKILWFSILISMIWWHIINNSFDKKDIMSSIWNFILLIYVIVLLLSSLFKRINDIWISKFYLLLIIVPYVNILLILFLIIYHKD